MKLMNHERTEFFEKFNDCFIESLSDRLPPERPKDHKIDFIPGSSPPNQPPYRVSLSQEEEIMKQGFELLEKGLSQVREASLRAENAAYAKAITAVQGQLQGKRQERFALGARLQEMEKEESTTRVELDSLLRAFVKNDEVVVYGGTVKENPPVMSFTDKSLQEGEELQRTRAELSMWENNVVRLEQEWLTLLQNSTRYPSAAQCEMELERRLRILSEQLVAKQGQSDTLAEERNSLQLRLTQVTENHRQGIVMDTEGTSNKVKTRKLVPALFSSASENLAQESKSFFRTAILETDPPLLAAVKRVTRQMFEILSTILSSWRHLCSSSAFRCFFILYILILHAVPFVVILSAT
ncbi:hypothetical protein L7F22_041793 [Adiantum nelumboides]|nr:hypothetical protein [Adiantum nelumboides]